MARRHVDLVYAGAKSHREALVHVYARLGAKGELDGRALMFAGPLGDHEPGDVIRAKCSNGDAETARAPSKVIGRWEVEDDVLAWQAAHAAAVAQERAVKSSLPNLVKAALEPVRLAYADLDEGERAVLMAKVACYISGGG